MLINVKYSSRKGHQEVLFVKEREGLGSGDDQRAWRLDLLGLFSSLYNNWFSSYGLEGKRLVSYSCT